jgi:hypothetical protein
MAKAVLLLNLEGAAQGQAILCAENTAEAREAGIPLLASVVAQITTGMEVLANGDDGYELFDRGTRVGTLEIFLAPAQDGPTNAQQTQ